MIVVIVFAVIAVGVVAAGWYQRRTHKRVMGLARQNRPVCARTKHGREVEGVITHFESRSDRALPLVRVSNGNREYEVEAASVRRFEA